MRNQDKQYIVNVVEQLVGKHLMQGILSTAEQLSTPYELKPLLEPQLKPKLAKMSAETLGRIIQYSDVDFRSHNSTLICREPILDRYASTQVSELLACFSVWPGHHLLEYLALLTILAVIFDMSKQLEYEREDTAEWERAEKGLPPVHLVPRL